MSRRGKGNKGWKSQPFLAQPELPPLPVIPSQWEELLRWSARKMRSKDSPPLSG